MVLSDAMKHDQAYPTDHCLFVWPFSNADFDLTLFVGVKKLILFTVLGMNTSNIKLWQWSQLSAVISRAIKQSSYSCMWRLTIKRCGRSHTLEKFLHVTLCFTFRNFNVFLTKSNIHIILLGSHSHTLNYHSFYLKNYPATRLIITRSNTAPSILASVCP